jgi:SEC-C motif-containing protein
MKVACPCGSGHLLARCCGRYLADFAGTPAPEAQALMRSRYTAFVLGHLDYLLATWHPDHRPADLHFEPGLKWLGLEVLGARSTGVDTAEVEFVARSRSAAAIAGAGSASRLHERSRFVRDNGRWYYLDGDLL